MVEARVTDRIKAAEPPPEARQPGAVVWVRKNLFNTPVNAVLTIVLLVVGVLVIRGGLAFLMAEDRQWEVIPRNSANYAIEAYPREAIGRTWLSLYLVMVLTGATLSVWRPRDKTTISRISAAVRSVGVVLAMFALLSPSTFGPRWTLFAAGAVITVGAALFGRFAGERLLERESSLLAAAGGSALLVLVGVWLLPVASTTKVPLTIAAACAFVAHVVGRFVVRVVSERALKGILVAAWLLLIPVVYLHVQRDPQIPTDRVSNWYPWIIPIALAGFGVLALVGRIGRDRAAVVNGLLVVVSIAVWAVSMPMMARFLLLTLAILSLATPTFGSSETGRRNMLLAWAGAALLLFYLLVLGVSSYGLPTRNEFYGGLNLTFMLAIAGILLSFPLGIALALGRTSTMPIFRLLSTGYIETVRGVPLITVLFFAVFVIPNFLPREVQLEAYVVVLMGITLFSAAYLAENVRGGLQSIPRGQYEAAKALGMTTAQMTMLITLPQALRAVIPAIVGQVISLFKDTSLVAIVGLADFFRVANNIVPGQPQSLGSKIENLVLAAIVYWIFTFSFSRASLRLERRLGVGTR